MSSSSHVPSSHKPAVRLDRLTKQYRIYPRPLDRIKQALVKDRQYFHPVESLKDVSLTLPHGETLGIVGRNGSGKSTLLQIIAGTLMPTSGSVEVDGRLAALLELGAGFNPAFSGRENVMLNASLIGLSRTETEARFDEIIAFAELEDFIDHPVRTYSNGMYVRLAFAIATTIEPEVLIIDEALAVGDEGFQRKCFSRLEDMQARGCTILFVSHNVSMVTRLCTRAILLDRGELILDGRPQDVASWYHRLTFAPPDRREAVRQQICEFEGATEPEELQEDRHQAESLPTSEEIEVRGAAQPHLDANLAEARAKVYEVAGARISHVELQNATGEKVNLLARDTSYYLTYKVEILEPLSQVCFGMGLRSVDGWRFGGMALNNYPEPIARIEAGQVRQVRFRFQCPLMDGVYFLNVACGSLEYGELKIRHRITDALMFRVHSVGAPPVDGPVDFQISPDVTTVEETESGPDLTARASAALP